MPLTRRQLVTREAEDSFTWEGETVTYRYLPGKITGKFLTYADDKEAFENLGGILVSTDILVEEDDTDMPEELRGKPLPTDAKSLELYYPVPLVFAFYRRIAQLVNNPN